MHLTAVTRLFLSPLLLAKKKAKADTIVVACESVATSFFVVRTRPRLGEKLEFVSWDPLVRKDVLYKESRKVRSLPAPRDRESFSHLPINQEAFPRERLWTRLQAYKPDLDKKRFIYHEMHEKRENPNKPIKKK